MKKKLQLTGREFDQFEDYPAPASILRDNDHLPLLTYL